MFSEPITVWSKKKNKKTKQYQIPCKSLWKLVYWQSFYQNIRPAIIGENKENATEVWGLENMGKVIKTLWHDYFTLCKSAKVANFQSIKAFHPTTENATNFILP